LRTVRATDLAAAAGSDFRSPIESDVLVATLDISNTGGGSWRVRVAREGSESDWPQGVTVSVKRADHGSYQALTPDLQTLFTGSGDDSNIQILLKLDGVTVQTAPRLYSLTVRYAIEATGL
jgi:hypothetical protein